MKSSCLLIGFEYLSTDKWKSLPGIPVDLYQVYQYSLKISNNIKVFTDIDCDHNTEILKQAIFNGHANSGLLSFIQDLKDHNHHYPFKSTFKSNHLDNNFESFLIQNSKNVDKMFIYYTGHAKKGNIILPDSTQVSIKHIYELLDCKEVIMILDCCEPDITFLPYQYQDHYHLINNNFSKKHILCLTSDTNKNTTSKLGSEFTRLLFNYLVSDNDNNRIISISGLNHDIEIEIFSTYHETIIFSWFTGFKNNMSINYDCYDGFIKIQLNNCQPTIQKSASIKDYLRYLI